MTSCSEKKGSQDFQKASSKTLINSKNFLVTLMISRNFSAWPASATKSAFLPLLLVILCLSFHWNWQLWAFSNEMSFYPHGATVYAVLFLAQFMLSKEIFSHIKKTICINFSTASFLPRCNFLLHLFTSIFPSREPWKNMQFCNQRWFTVDVWSARTKQWKSSSMNAEKWIF